MNRTAGLLQALLASFGLGLAAGVAAVAETPAQPRTVPSIVRAFARGGR